MGEIKNFLDRRAEGLAKERGTNQDIDLEENINLTDDEFWGILKQFKQESRSGKKTPSDILQEILEQYSAVKINQFAERYKKLNE